MELFPETPGANRGTQANHQERHGIMDPNLVQATLRSCQSPSQGRGRHPLHLEREMVVYEPANRHSRRSWTMAMRRRGGAGLILLGGRLRGATRSTTIVADIQTAAGEEGASTPTS